MFRWVASISFPAFKNAGSERIKLAEAMEGSFWPLEPKPRVELPVAEVETMVFSGTATVVREV